MGSHEESRFLVTEDEIGGFRVVIRVAAHPLFRYILPVWFCGWLVGEIVTSMHIVSGGYKGMGPEFLYTWLFFWTIGGALGFLSLAWNWFGRDVIVISDGWMETRREIGGFSRSRSFDLSKVSGLRYAPIPQPYSLNTNKVFQQWGIGCGTIVFDYTEGHRLSIEIYRFGDHLPEQEARLLLKTIEPRFIFPEGPAIEPLPAQHG